MANTSSAITSVKYLIHGNYTAVFAGPLYSMMMGEAVVKSINPAVGIKVTLAPLPFTNQEKVIRNNYNVNLVSF